MIPIPLEVISQLSGVTRLTVHKYFTGKIRYPRVETIKKFVEAFKALGVKTTLSSITD